MCRLNKRILKYSVDVHTALQTLSSDATQNMSTLLVYIIILPSRRCKNFKYKDKPLYIFSLFPLFFLFLFRCHRMPLPRTVLFCGFKGNDKKKTYFWHTDCNTSTLSAVLLMPLPPNLLFLNLPDSLLYRLNKMILNHNFNILTATLNATQNFKYKDKPHNLYLFSAFPYFVFFTLCP